MSRPIQTVEFRRVSFRYPRTGKWLLKNLNLTLKYGERVGLVGRNGAGKTTVIKLMMRLYDPDKGRILINGKDIREFDIESYGCGKTRARLSK